MCKDNDNKAPRILQLEDACVDEVSIMASLLDILVENLVDLWALAVVLAFQMVNWQNRLLLVVESLHTIKPVNT